VVNVTYLYGSIIGFRDRSLYFFFQVAPQLYSDPLLLRKSGSAGNRTRTSGSVTRNSDHQTTEAVDDADDDDDNNNNNNNNNNLFMYVLSQQPKGQLQSNNDRGQTEQILNGIQTERKDTRII
jgi:hypothetical protein